MLLSTILEKGIFSDMLSAAVAVSDAATQVDQHLISQQNI